mgnify:CR=1 FL=1
MRLLIAEDERDLAEALSVFFEKNQFTVDTVYNGFDAYEYASTGEYDAAILDVMMPKLDGFQVARQVRADRCTTPILMLTARSDIEDRIQGLNAGADYYLTKPFEPRELIACVRALSRRTPEIREDENLTCGDLRLELTALTLWRGEENVRLSRKECDLLELLIRNRKLVLSKESILVKIWGYESEAEDNNVEVYIGFLRKKLNSIGSNVTIAAVRRMGYRLEVQEGC